MRVSKRTTYIVSVNDETHRLLESEEYFNPKEQLIEYITYFQGGQMEQQELHFYNENDLLILEKTIHADAGVTETKYTYDVFGIVASTIVLINGEFMHKQFIIKNNNEVQYLTVNSADEEIEKRVDYYDKDEIVSSSHFSWGEMTQEQQFKYGVKGLLISKTCTFPEEERVVEVFYEYNHNKILIKEIHKEDGEIIYSSERDDSDRSRQIEKVNDEGEVYRIEYLTSKSGTMEEDVMYREDGMLLTRLIRKMNTYGDLIEERYYNTSPDLIHGESYIRQFELEYD